MIPLKTALTFRNYARAIASVAAVTLAVVELSVGSPGLVPAPAYAQSAAQSAAETCAPRPGRLGVSRVVEIDTSRGPRFGAQQYADHDLLREGEVVLTFDDGPLRRHSRMVLEALAAHCTRAAFYMVGQMALADPEMVREIARAGHTIAIHTWSHKNLRSAGSANATKEIELGISAVQRALGQPVSPFFRFPYLADSPAMISHLADRNFGIFSIDVDSRDFRTQDPRKMQRTVMDALAPKKKGILLFHDIQFSTAHGIRGVLDELASRGYKVVHLVPKGQAQTQPGYDAMADAEFTRRNKLAAAQPMASRSVVWPMTPPGVVVEHYQSHSATGAAAARAPARTAPVRPAAAGGGAVLPVPATAIVTSPPAAQQPAPVAQPQPQQERPALRGSAEDEDWRRRVFQQ